ncbi:MAG: hypothetical protein JWQ74_1413 [Marmoricola sp.]|nr:hypothetical protein [Marmoricola sp.]
MRWPWSRHPKPRGGEALQAAHERDAIVAAVAHELSELHRRNHYAERLSTIMRGHA